MEWKDVVGEIRLAYERKKEFIVESVLIGGGACLYHKQQFEKANDPDFPPRQYTIEEEACWKSHDADFAILGKTEFMDTSGLRIGTVQFGLRLGSEQFNENAQKVSLTFEDGLAFNIKVADPLDLYREKQVAVQKRKQPQDKIHLDMLADLVKMRLCRLADALSLNFVSTSVAEKFAERVKNYTPELLCDERVAKRLGKCSKNEVFIELAKESLAKCQSTIPIKELLGKGSPPIKKLPKIDPPAEEIN